ncbi:MAG: GTP pyrophosphokinase [Magnetococcales bacterium]|nr:GTP pyrophosphokinase [Magnetococcales bacterium]
MSTLERAIAIATSAHAGQLDKAGEPYILHPLRLMMKISGEKGRITAVLHDVVEDSPITLQDLRAEGFCETVLTALTALTHLPDESYEAYLERVLVHPLARNIKRLDLEDNMNIQRLGALLSDRDLARLKKYRAAWEKVRHPPPTETGPPP